MHNRDTKVLSFERIVRAFYFRLVVKPRETILRINYRVRNHYHRIVVQLVDRLPVPPPHLISFTTGNEDVPWFIKSGKLGAESLDVTLRKNGIDIYQFEAILDFGCGIGRVIRHFRSLQKTKIYGTDYNHELIAWCKKCIKFAYFRTNPIHGPLDFEDEFFDFIYALSVFTHLTEEQQFYWIEELTRVLKPGGFLFITVHGVSYLHTMNPEDHDRFNRGELVVYGSQHEGGNLCTTYHPDRYVRDKLAKSLILVDHIPTGALGNPHQDVYLFKNLLLT